MLPHRANPAIAETMEIAGTSLPASRYRSEIRWGRNSAEDSAAKEARDAVATFSVGPGASSKPSILAWFDGSRRPRLRRGVTKFGETGEITVYFRRYRAGPARAGPALHI